MIRSLLFTGLNCLTQHFSSYSEFYSNIPFCTCTCHTNSLRLHRKGFLRKKNIGHKNTVHNLYNHNECLMNIFAKFYRNTMFQS